MSKMCDVLGVYWLVCVFYRFHEVCAVHPLRIRYVFLFEYSSRPVQFVNIRLCFPHYLLVSLYHHNRVTGYISILNLPERVTTPTNANAVIVNNTFQCFWHLIRFVIVLKHFSSHMWYVIGTPILIVAKTTVLWVWNIDSTLLLWILLGMLLKVSTFSIVYSTLSIN